MNSDVIIVGAGQAAAQLCLSLRAGGFQDRILMIGAERFAPYQRPPLSKKFLTERRPPDTLLLRPQTLWRDQGVELMLETQVVGLDLARRTLSITDAQARSRELAYGTLVLATGTRARDLERRRARRSPAYSRCARSTTSTACVPRSTRPAASSSWAAAISGSRSPPSCARKAAQVMVLEAEDRLLKRVTGTDMSAFFEALHRERGVDIRLGARLAEVTGEGAVSGVRLADGTARSGRRGAARDRGAGQRRSRPRRRARLPRRHPGRRAVPAPRCRDVYAIGDCTRFPSGRFGRHVRLESVQNAIDQAKAAAGAILGAPRPYDPVPWFWSDQYEIKLQMAGLSDGYDRRRGGRRARRATVLRGIPGAAAG